MIFSFAGIEIPVGNHPALDIREFVARRLMRVTVNHDIRVMRLGGLVDIHIHHIHDGGGFAALRGFGLSARLAGKLNTLLNRKAERGELPLRVAGHRSELLILLVLRAPLIAV